MDEVGADGDDVADVTAHPRDGAGDWRRDLDGGLVGQHLDDRLVDVDGVARLHVPRDDLGLGDALADIRQLHHELAAHAATP